MRDPKRMRTFLDEVEKIWAEKFPDWRFGQLMFNFISTYGDPFHLEEKEFLIALRAYSEGKDPREAVLKELERRVNKRSLQDKINYFNNKDPQ